MEYQCKVLVEVKKEKDMIVKKECGIKKKTRKEIRDHIRDAHSGGKGFPRLGAFHRVIR